MNNQMILYSVFRPTCEILNSTLLTTLREPALDTIVTAIAIDLPRTFPKNPHFQAGHQLQQNSHLFSLSLFAGRSIVDKIFPNVQIQNSRLNKRDSNVSISLYEDSQYLQQQ